jgi:trk system potassium uptake protein TrkA
MNVLIAGAGNVGRYLARILVEADHTVTLIEREASQVERACQESGARVVRGDASEPSLLEKAGVRGMDVVVAVTGDDEDNIVVCNLSKFEFEVPRVVARVKNALNTWLYEPDIGVDVVVSAPNTIAQLIEEEVVVDTVVELFKLRQAQAAIVETTIPEGSPVAGQTIGKVAWPSGCVPLAIVRDRQLLAASPDILIEADDRLLCVADMAQRDALHSLVMGPLGGVEAHP